MNVVIDSGASTCILPRGNAKDYPLLQRSHDRTYTSASKAQVRPEGEKKITLGLMNGDEYDSQREVADVHRPLPAVSKLVSKGKRIIFDSDDRGGSWMYDHIAGKYIQLYERDGVCVLPAWIRPPQEEKQESVFGRPAVQP